VQGFVPGKFVAAVTYSQGICLGELSGVCPDSLAGLQVSVSSGYDKVTITDLRGPVFYGTQGSFLLLNFVVVNLGDNVGLTGAPLFK